MIEIILHYKDNTKISMMVKITFAFDGINYINKYLKDICYNLKRIINIEKN